MKNAKYALPFLLLAIILPLTMVKMVLAVSAPLTPPITPPTIYRQPPTSIELPDPTIAPKLVCKVSRTIKSCPNLNN